jgi:hypothetical protein
MKSTYYYNVKNLKKMEGNMVKKQLVEYERNFSV